MWKYTYKIAIEYENTGKIICSTTKSKKVNLGSWIAQNKKAYINCDLSPDKVTLLCNLSKFNKWHKNMKLKQDKIIFNDWIQACKKYEQSLNKLITISTTYKEYNIGKWLAAAVPIDSYQMKKLKTIKSYKFLSK